jgi:hypothetical protein
LCAAGGRAQRARARASFTGKNFARRRSRGGAAGRRGRHEACEVPSGAHGRRPAMKMFETMKMLTILVLLAASAMILMR